MSRSQELHFHVRTSLEGPRALWRAATATALASILFAMSVYIAPAAFADASSGYIYVLTTGPYGSNYVDNCLDAVISSAKWNDAYSISDYNPNRCGDPYYMPAGWISVLAEGYNNGNYCGSSGWAENSSSVFEFGVGAILCSGHGNIFTDAFGRWWDLIYNRWQYTPYVYVTSPSQNF